MHWLAVNVGGQINRSRITMHWSEFAFNIYINNMKTWRWCIILTIAVRQDSGVQCLFGQFPLKIVSHNSDSYLLMLLSTKKTESTQP